MGPEMAEVSSMTDRATRPAPPKLQIKSKAGTGANQGATKAGSMNRVAIIAGTQAMDGQVDAREHESRADKMGSRRVTLASNTSPTMNTEEPLKHSEKSWSTEKVKLTTAIDQYKRQAIQAEEAHEKAQKATDKLKAQLDNALAALKETQDELSVSQQKVITANKNAEEMSDKCDEIEEEAVQALEKLQKEHAKQLGTKDGRIRQLLDQAMAGKAEGKWNPVPDGETRRQLTVLNNEIRSFSKDWAASSLEALESLMKVPVVARYYSRFVRVFQGRLPPSLRNVSPKILEKLPAVLLNAAVADEVQDSFFGNPFFCISVEAQPAFKKILTDLVKVNPKEAHQWRCLLWRILCPKSVNLFENNEHPSEAETNIKEYVSLVEECFSKCPANLLFKEPLTEADRAIRSESLRKIFRSAATIAIGLWSQPAHISSLTLPRLWQQNMKFDVTSNVLQGHPLSKVDEDDPEHNGREISVVTRPALLVFDSEEDEIIAESKSGNSGGDGYRVLSKAIVLLDEKR